jgi:hypothetical protein
MCFRFYPTETQVYIPPITNIRDLCTAHLPPPPSLSLVAASAFTFVLFTPSTCSLFFLLPVTGIQLSFEGQQLSLRCVPIDAEPVLFDFSVQPDRWYCIALVRDVGVYSFMSRHCIF